MVARNVELEVRHCLIFLGIEVIARLDAVCELRRQARRWARNLCIYIAGIISDEFPSLTKELPEWPVQQLRWPFSNSWRSAAALRVLPKMSALRHPPVQVSSSHR